VSVTAIVVAAGEGVRLGGSTPKGYLSIGGRPLIVRTVEKFFLAQTITNIILVIAEKELQRSQELLGAESRLSGKRCSLQTGGATRQASVMRGLAQLDPECEFVAIHDGARPFVDPSRIDQCVEAARERGAAVLGVPVRDTIKIVSKDYQVDTTPPRSFLWEIQTPQVFRKEWIVQAHDQASRDNFEATDDATLVERMGKAVFVLEGDRTNIKITTPEDVVLAEALLRGGRVG
jgi:2-C-methyl-D-erythritol 4-phosphate cytidylyltransferase